MNKEEDLKKLEKAFHLTVNDYIKLYGRDTVDTILHGKTSESDELLDIHYCILIKRYGSIKALEMLKDILPKNYIEDIEKDTEKPFIISDRKSMHLYHCRNRWNLTKQKIYLRKRFKETKNDLYLKIMNYQDMMNDKSWCFEVSRSEEEEATETKTADIDVEAIEEAYLKLIE